MQDYGCEECGVVGWRRDGEAIVSAGEKDGVPHVERLMNEPGSQVGGSWMAECGHRVRSGSILERFFNALPAGEVTALPRNG